MKRISLIIVLILLVFSIKSQHRKSCGFGKIYQELQNSPDFVERQQAFNAAAKQNRSYKSDTVIIIPTVIHIIQKMPSENLSRDQIQSQIDALNRDFGKLNADTTNVASEFNIANVKFKFALATVDPEGNETWGITRHSTTTDDIGLTSEYYSIQPAWNNRRYLNIWVCDVGDELLGFAYPPNTPGVSPQEDGIVIGSDYFGTIGTVKPPYNLGRTTTHEVGHYFNLLHIWGNDFSLSCSNDDLVSDTPSQDTVLYDCPSTNFSCGSKDMVSNYMGYLDDRCMGGFTLGQKNRMRNALYLLRDSLEYGVGIGITSIQEVNPLHQVSLFPNPSQREFQLEIPPSIRSEQLDIRITNLQGKEVNFRTKGSIHGLSIELTDASKGIYFLQLEKDNFSVTKKLIKH